MSDRAFIFDNSAGDHQQASFIAEIEQGQTIRIQSNIEQLPNWFVQYVLDQF